MSTKPTGPIEVDRDRAGAVHLLPMGRRRQDRPSVVLVSVDSGAPSEAGWVTGRVALPVAAEWGAGTAPSGRYAVAVSTGAPRTVVRLRGVEHEAVIFATSVRRRPRSRTSELTLAMHGASYRVRTLELGDPGIILHFDPPTTARTRLEGAADRSLNKAIPGATAPQPSRPYPPSIATRRPV